MNAQEDVYSGIDNSVTIKHGYVKMKSRQMGGFWKKRYIVLYTHSSMGSSRLVKYTDKAEANRGDKFLSEIKMMDVRSVVRLASDDLHHGITLNMSGEVRQFLCDDEREASDWLQKLTAETGREDNLPKGMFRAFLMPSAQLNNSGECVVSIQGEKLILSESPDLSGRIVEWNIKFIRRYAVDEEKNLLKIENGRRQLQTGEGLCILRTTYHDQIRQHLDTASRRLSQGSQMSGGGSHQNSPRPSLTPGGNAAQVPVPVRDKHTYMNQAH